MTAQAHTLKSLYLTIYGEIDCLFLGHQQPMTPRGPLTATSYHHPTLIPHPLSFAAPDILGMYISLTLSIPLEYISNDH